jgi:capsular exopolysaccharide synthesis family protein
MGKGTDMLQSLGIMSGANSVDNELEIITTYSVLDKVVKDLQLNISYTKKDIFGKTTEASIEMPWETVVLNYNEEGFSKNHEYIFVASSKAPRIIIDGETMPIGWNQAVKLPVGTVIFRPKLGKSIKNEEWDLSIKKPTSITESYTKSITADVPNKKANIINLSMESSNPEMGRKIINKVIDTYISDNLKDNNSINDSTMMFINARLVEVTKELNDVERAVQSFKQKNNVTDIVEQTKVLLEATKENNKDLIQSEIQLNVVSSLENYLKNNKTHIIPSNLLTADPSLAVLVNQYNALIVQKQKLSKNATSENPTLISVNSQINSVKEELLSSVQSAKNSYSIVANQLRGQSNKNIGMIKKIPEQERQFLDISRQQAIKQELYLFLLKKREETAIGRSSTLSNIRVVDYARIVDKPISPKKNSILLIGLIIGIIIPIAVSYIRKIFNFKIETRNDITERTTIPIIGEISHKDEPSNFEVKDNPRSPLAEQFRILRTNLHFYQQKESAFTVMLTSYMTGEGKTFICLNLASTLAANIGSKILIIGLDLRKAQMAKELGMQKKKGFSECVIGDATLDEVIYPVEGFKNLWALPSGSIPPNPSELLMTKETEELFAEVKKRFDYVIVDCPPIIVTDSSIIGKYVDLTLYVSRIGHTEKKQIEVANNLYLEEKMPKMNLVVNDFNPEKYDHYNSNYYNQYYYYYENAEERKPLWKRWFKL